jgi:Homeodomain-like domain
MAVCVGIRPITDDEGMRLVRIVRRGSGSVVTWRRVQMLLLSAQGMPVGRIAEATFTSPDRVRDVLHNFNPDGVRLPVSPLCGMAALPQVGFLCCGR